MWNDVSRRPRRTVGRHGPPWGQGAGQRALWFLPGLRLDQLFVIRLRFGGERGRQRPALRVIPACVREIVQLQIRDEQVVLWEIVLAALADAYLVCLWHRRDGECLLERADGLAPFLLLDRSKRSLVRLDPASGLQ